MSAEFEVRTETVTVVHLYRNGEVIVDEHGKPREFGSPDEALHVSMHWDDYRALTWAELTAMTDEQVYERARRAAERPQR